MSEEVLSQINDTIRKIEIMNINQNTLNEIYAEIKSLFLAEMSKLPDLPSSNCKQGRRQKRKANPFWNNELNDLWVIRCNKETIYSDFSCNSRHDLHQKEILRNQFKLAQKHFDKKFRFFKRLHNSGKLKDLEHSAEKDPNEMWKILKSLSEPKLSKVIMEVLNEDETISTDIKELLKRGGGRGGPTFQQSTTKI